MTLTLTLTLTVTLTLILTLTLTLTLTFFQDRPDVMAKYDVRLEADAAYPVLLSNGNEDGSGDAGDGRRCARFT